MNIQGIKNSSHCATRVAGAVLLTTILAACGSSTSSGSSSSTGSTSSGGSTSSSSSTGSSGGSNSSSTSSSSGGPVVPKIVSLQEKCIIGFEAHQTDGSLEDEYYEYKVGNNSDATLRPEIIEWMDKHEWQEGHSLWHDSRRCRSGFGGGGGMGCDFSEISQPAQDECRGPQDGYEFLAMHRHMIQTLKSLWPSMNDQFAGWSKFPTKADYPANLQDKVNAWPDAVLRAADAADRISQMSRQEVLQEWPSEGEFAQWIQCGSGGGFASNGLHGALHFNGISSISTHNVSNPKRNLDAYLFWKLHGWIDNVWEEYRIATGKSSDDQGLQAEIIKQCQEHHYWAERVDPSLKEIEVVNTTGTGYFHDYVRPAMATCAAGCHVDASTSGLSLSNTFSSEELAQRLVNVDAGNVKDYKYVVPGDPDSSWLYMKVSGDSENSNASCNRNGCTGHMAGMSQEGINYLRQWIQDGAPIN